MYIGGLPAAQAVPAAKIRPSLLSPANQAVLTASLPTPLAARGSLPLQFTKNGATIGGGTTPGGFVANLTWTPSSTDFNGQLVAQNAAGASASRSLVVAEANRFNTAASSGTKTNVTVVLDASITDPFYGGPLYGVTAAVNATAANHLLSLSATAGTAGINSGLEIVAEVSAGFPILRIYPSTGDSHRYIDINVATGDTFGNYAYAKVIERKGNFARIWFRPEVYSGTAYPTQAVGFYFMKAFGTPAAVTDGTETLRVGQPRSVDGVLPFTNAQLLQARLDGLVNSADRWFLRSGFVNSAASLNADMVASRQLTGGTSPTYDYQNRGALGVLKPDSYTTTKKYRVIYMLTVETVLTAAYGDPLYIVQQLGLHNSMDCIFVCSTLGPNLPWYGANADGVTVRLDAFIRDQIVGFVDERYSTIATREGRSLVGFSKSGWGALSLILLNPSVFGYAAVWDSPWGLAYSGASTTQPTASYPEIATQFGTEAQFHLYNPLDVVASNAASLKDRKRLVLAGGCAFTSDIPPMTSALNGAGIPYTYRFNDLSSNAANHQWNSGWLPNVLSDLAALW